MLTKKQVSGFKGESFAATYLEKKGYKIIGRNFRALGGEIDIIALDGNTLAFIEVKARSGSEYGTPLEAITKRKMRSIIHTAQFYKMKNPKLPDAMRIDAVAIDFDGFNEVRSIELVKNIS